MVGFKLVSLGQWNDYRELLQLKDKSSPFIDQAYRIPNGLSMYTIRYMHEYLPNLYIAYVFAILMG